MKYIKALAIKGISMKCIKVFAIMVVLGVGGGLALIYSGIMNIAATNPHSSLVYWALSTASSNSIRYHAKDIKAPSVDSQEMIFAGFHHYREMCMGCHLSPGVQSSEIRTGLMPQPPKLQDVAAQWTPAELFWVIKNGIKMTGMPAWGPTHSDKKIWDLVAFVKNLPKMTAEQYKAMDAAAGPDLGDGGNSH
ncbi:MAG: cytochrome c [Mariprofundales bacterium]|nr:cytochrome c [Mariprofundales bacterium]